MMSVSVTPCPQAYYLSNKCRHLSAFAGAEPNATARCDPTVEGQHSPANCTEITTRPDRLQDPSQRVPQRLVAHSLSSAFVGGAE